MSGTGEAQGGRTRRRVVAAIVVVGLIGFGIIYGPLLVSGNYHRAAIERLATDAVGRQVTIAGPIALALFPGPQLRARTITIGSEKGGLITADTLKLDLAPWPLLLGRLRATRLTLRKPYVALPWPLPGGARAIAPPPWLASLHATIVDGRLQIGALVFDHVDLSIFTGGPSAVLAASGSVRRAGVVATITLDIDNTGGRAPAPVTAAVTVPGAKGRAATHLGFKGTIDRASVIEGRLTGSIAPAAIAAAAADRNAASAPALFRADLAASQGWGALPHPTTFTTHHPSNLSPNSPPLSPPPPQSLG